MKSFAFLVVAAAFVVAGFSSVQAHCGKCEKGKTAAAEVSVKDKSSSRADNAEQKKGGSGCCKDKSTTSSLAM